MGEVGSQSRGIVSKVSYPFSHEFSLNLPRASICRVPFVVSYILTDSPTVPSSLCGVEVCFREVYECTVRDEQRLRCFLVVECFVANSAPKFVVTSVCDRLSNVVFDEILFSQSVEAKCCIVVLAAEKTNETPCPSVQALPCSSIPSIKRSLPMNKHQEVPIRFMQFTIPEVVGKLESIIIRNFLLTFLGEGIKSQIIIANLFSPFGKSIRIEVFFLRCESDKLFRCFFLNIRRDGDFRKCSDVSLDIFVVLRLRRMKNNNVQDENLQNVKIQPQIHSAV